MGQQQFQRVGQIIIIIIIIIMQLLLLFYKIQTTGEPRIEPTNITASIFALFYYIFSRFFFDSIYAAVVFVHVAMLKQRSQNTRNDD